MSPSTPRIRFDGVSKRYPGVLALDQVGFDVVPGCVHALVGENGAGKSTLMKILAGATSADEGSIYVDGHRALLRDALDAQKLGVAIVYQELSVVPDLTVSENVFLGRWKRGRFGHIRFSELHREAEVLLASLGVDIAVRRRVRELSAAGKQMVEIARALSLNARVLVLDEPSAVLTPHELQALFRLIRRLAKDGVSILYISHRLDEVFELADFVTVLRDGRHVSTRLIGEVNRDLLIREMVGRTIAEEFPIRSSKPSKVALAVKHLAVKNRFREVTFEVRAGEVFAMTGLVGSGRSSLAKALFGALRVSRGSVQVGDCRGPFGSPRAAQRAGVAFVSEDRKLQGLLLERPLRENISLACLKDVATVGIINLRNERMMVRDRMEQLGIKAPNCETQVKKLSGGNQQKVMLARWLSRTYSVIILDEPTRGVDVAARAEIYGLIGQMADHGTAVLVMTSELPEALGLADRVGVMVRGRLAGVLDNTGRTLTQESLLRLAVGESGLSAGGAFTNER